MLMYQFEKRVLREPDSIFRMEDAELRRALFANQKRRCSAGTVDAFVRAFRFKRKVMMTYLSTVRTHLDHDRVGNSLMPMDTRSAGKKLQKAVVTFAVMAPQWLIMSAPYNLTIHDKFDDGSGQYELILRLDTPKEVKILCSSTEDPGPGLALSATGDGGPTLKVKRTMHNTVNS